MNTHRRTTPTISGDPPPRRGQAGPPDERGSKPGWFVRAFTDGFLDARKTPLSDRAFRVFMVLDARAAMDPFCFPGNDWICERADKKERSLREIFVYLEEAGFLLRVYTDETQKERVGFILLRRVDPAARAAENTAGGIERATRAMLETIARRDGGNPPSRPDVTAEIRRQDPPCRRKSAVPDGGNPPSHDGGNPPPYEECISQEDSVCETTTKDAGSSSSHNGFLTQGEGETEQAADEPTPAGHELVISKAVELWEDSPALRARMGKVCREYDEAEVLGALKVAANRVDRTGSSVTFGYFKGTLKNSRAEGGVVGPSKSKAERDAAKGDASRRQIQQAIEEAEARGKSLTQRGIERLMAEDGDRPPSTLPPTNRTVDTLANYNSDSIINKEYNHNSNKYDPPPPPPRAGSLREDFMAKRPPEDLAAFNAMDPAAREGFETRYRGGKWGEAVVKDMYNTMGRPYAFRVGRASSSQPEMQV